MSTEFYEETVTNHDRTETVSVSVIRGCFNPPGSESRCGVVVHLFNGLDEDGQPVFIDAMMSQAEAQRLGQALIDAGRPLGGEA